MLHSEIQLDTKRIKIYETVRNTCKYTELPKINLKSRILGISVFIFQMHEYTSVIIRKRFLKLLLHTSSPQAGNS